MFLDKFSSFITDLNTNPVTDEWYMSKFVDENIKILSSNEAFEILKSFTIYMIENYDPCSEYEIMETLRYLKIQANTNEKFCTKKQKSKIFSLYRQNYSQRVLFEIF